MLKHIQVLDTCAYCDEPIPTRTFDWLEKLDNDFVDRLVRFDLIKRYVLEQRRPIAELVRCFVGTMRTRNRDANYIRTTERRLLRTFEAARAATYKDITVEGVETAFAQFRATSGFKGKTPYHYAGEARSFCKWMVDTNRARLHRLLALPVPSPDDDPSINRRPINRDDFDRLIAYTVSVDRPSPKRGLWSGSERALIYRTAANTGFRYSELVSLTPAHIDFTTRERAMIGVKAKDAKNGTRWEIPLTNDLARDLQTRCSMLSPHSPLLPFPKEHKKCIDTFRLDLEGAGLAYAFDNGDRVDFHTLRSTAICWWCLRPKANLANVQFLSRLKSLELVAKYIRRYSPNLRELLGDEEFI